MRYSTTMKYTVPRTDHSEEITALRAESSRRMRDADPTETSVEQATIISALQASAALLEVHDNTGISLDDWIGPRELVEDCLMLIGLPARFLRNNA